MNRLLVLAFLFIVLLLMSGYKCEHISITKDVSLVHKGEIRYLDEIT